jgi:putative restriction endonuclease
MAKAVFYHRPDSPYKDDPASRYHFPRLYLSRVEKVVGDHVVYYGPNDRGIRGYFAVARVAKLVSDPGKSDHYFALIDEYLNFDRHVPYREGGGFEKKLFRPDGSINGGYAQNAVRFLTDMEFAAIVGAGLSEADEWPDRVDEPEIEPYEPHSIVGFGEAPQAVFERPVFEQILNRRFRDRKFRQHVRVVYDRTCAFTGLRLINGQGRPEVEAAHIRPVEENGSDAITNGIALSGTVHWMFDRGLLSLADDFRILVSRHLNHDVSNLLRKEMRAWVPENPGLRPHPDNLAWHRENRFKG